jgi:hypothetical protein
MINPRYKIHCGGFNNPTTNEIDSVLFFVLEEFTFRCFTLEPFQTSHSYIFGVRSGREFQSRNLLEDDSTREQVMQESGAFQMPAVLRQIFVDLLCVLANKRISSILKQSSSPYQGLYKKLKS